MIFKGTPTRPAGAIEKEVKSYGGFINASTGLDSTTYHMTMPKENTDKALGLIEDIIFHPALLPEEVLTEKEVVLKEIKLNRDDPAKRVMENLWQTAFIKHPYKEPVIGRENIFAGIRREDVLLYHAINYAPNRLILTVAGDVEENEILKKIEEIFGKYEKKPDPEIVTPVEPVQYSERLSTDFTAINLGYIAMGYHTVRLKSEDLYALDVLGIILGDWDGSRLEKKLVKEKRLLYTVSSFNYTPKYPGLFIIYGIGDHAKLEKAKQAILAEIYNISKKGVSPEELDVAKNMVIASYLDSLETMDGLAGAISQSEFLANDPAFFEKYVSGVRGLDRNDIINAARKYLNINNLTTSYVYPEGVKIAPPRKRKSGRVFPSVPSGKKSVQTGGFAEKEFFARETKAEKTTLPNGLRFILKEDRTLPRTTVFCLFLGGIRAETKENNGISNLTSMMLLKGTKERKEFEIRPLVESLGGQISSFSGENALGLSLDFFSENQNASLDILEDALKNSVFPEDELEKAKERVCASIKAEDADIYSTGFRKLRGALFFNHPYAFRVLGEADSVKKISRADVEKFYRKFVSAHNMVLVAIGDFDLNTMRSDLTKRFAGMNKSVPDLEIPSPAPFKGLKDLNYEMDKEQSLFIVGFRGMTIHDPEKYKLAVLSSIMSGENGRLSASVREKLGLAYVLGTFSAPLVDTGYFVSYVGTDKKHLAEAKDAVIGEIGRIRTDGVSEEEFGLAKAYLIGMQKIFLQRDKSLARQVAYDEIFGLGYETYLKYPEYISAVTMEGLSEAIKKYIDPDNAVIIRITGKDGEE